MPDFPRPRLRLNQPALRESVRACGTPGWLLAYQCGITHHSCFSILINAEEIPASPINIERLERIADAIGFPQSRLFVGGARIRNRVRARRSDPARSTEASCAQS